MRRPRHPLVHGLVLESDGLVLGLEIGVGRRTEMVEGRSAAVFFLSPQLHPRTMSVPSIGTSLVDLHHPFA